MFGGRFIKTTGPGRPFNPGQIRASREFAEGRRTVQNIQTRLNNPNLKPNERIRLMNELNEKKLRERQLKKKAIEAYIKRLYGDKPVTVDQVKNDIKNNPTSENSKTMVTNFQEGVGKLETYVGDAKNAKAIEGMDGFMKFSIYFMLINLGGSMLNIFALQRLIDPCKLDPTSDDPESCGKCYQVDLKKKGIMDSVKEVSCSKSASCNCQLITGCGSFPSCGQKNDRSFYYYWNNMDLETIMADFPNIASQTFESPENENKKDLKTKFLRLALITVFLIGIGYFTFKLFKRKETKILKYKF